MTLTTDTEPQLSHNDTGFHPLQVHAEFAVPFMIEEIKARGGPDDLDWKRCEKFAHELGARGDVLLFGGEGAGKLASEMCACLAILAFVPGGVTFVGRHWEATI